MSRRIGTPHDAQRAAWGIDIPCGCGCETRDAQLYLAGADDDDPRLTKRIIGRGESRTAWLVNGVIYKVGRDSVNRSEHEALTEWREAGAAWAPMTTLYTASGWYGEQVLVLAMAYLPDDGGSIDGATLAQIRKAAPQTCRENYVAHGGRTYLIDGGDIEVSPDTEEEQ